MHGTRAELRARPNIAALAPYPLAERSADGSVPAINLASNENSAGPSEQVLEAVRAAYGDLNRYPEASAAALREAIGRQHGLDPDRIVCANGSSELVLLIANAFLSPGAEVLVSRTGYLLFATAAQIAGADVVRVDTQNLVFDVEAALAAVTPRTRLLFLDNPNNPSGTIIGREALRALRIGLRPDILLVIDAAYAEYVTDTDYEAGASLVDEFHNCVMLRTFSKIYGLAALRVGWAYAPPGVADLLHRIRQPNNLAAPSIAGAAAAVGDGARVAAISADNAAVRADFTGALRSLGATVPNSQSNFVLATFNQHHRLDCRELYEGLKRNGILLRPMDPYGLPDSLRITIGTRQEMRTVADAIEDFFTPASGVARG